MFLSGCAFGPLPSSTGRDGVVTGSVGRSAAEVASIDEIHSSTCPGLALEREERIKRIDSLKAKVAVEVAAPPATLVQAVLRASGSPDEGTAAFREMSAERTHLESLSAAAAKMGCPVTVDVAVKSP